MRKLILILAGLGLALSLAAEATRTWEQKSYADFDKGTAQKVSLRSDGKIQLAPRFRQLADSGLSYIWALAEDKKGNVYIGGGSPAKIIRVAIGKSDKDAPLKPEAFFSAKELEVHALAVNTDDNVYAATSPDPKIYKITPDGQSTVFFEPKAKYVWGMLFDPQGGLLIATGDKGEIYRVERNGQGKIFCNSDEVHARSLAIDRQGNLIVGTDPSGLVMRITPAGQAFILYQAPKKEVTALEVGPDGSIYAAVVGDRPPSSMTPGAPQPVAPVVVSVPAPTGPTPPAPPPVAGGTNVYRIFPDGEPRRIWTSKEEVVYALALRDATGPQTSGPAEARPGGQTWHPLLAGSGNKGKVFQIEEPDSYSSLVKAQAMQVTAFLKLKQGPGPGPILAATSNGGKLMEIGAEYESEGTYESEVFDARNFSLWGRISWRAEALAGATVSLFTRSGNVDNPDRNWSPWSPALTTPGQKSASPGARFIQWKAVLTSPRGQSTPWLDTAEIAYLPKNLPPVIDQVEVTPAGYKFQTSAGVPPAGNTLTLPALGQPRNQPAPAGARFEPPVSMQQAHDWQGVRWAAHDDNDDTLVYSLFIRGKDERNWKRLKDKISEKSFAWDSTTFPDGIYLVKVAASDAPANAEAEALTDEQESMPFVIDNTPPAITGLKASPSANKIRVTFSAADALSTIKKAEYAVDGGEWRPVLPVGRLSDSPREDYSFEVDGGEGEHTVAVRVYDRFENAAVAKIVVR